MKKNLLFLVFTIFLAGCSQKSIVLKEENMTIEYGETFSTNLEDYINVDESKDDVLTKAKLDMSGVQLEQGKDYPSLGDHKLYIIYDDDKYEINISVKDTIAPEIKKSVDTLIYTKDMKPTSDKILKNFEFEDVDKVEVNLDDSQVDYSQVGKYTATITVSDSSQNETQKEITIEIQEPTIRFNKKEVDLEIGETVTLKTTIKGKDNKITYKSSNDKIATVNSNGKVTAKKEGTVTITASCNGVKTQCRINVKGIHISNAKEAIAYVKKYLKESNEYVPQYIEYDHMSENGYVIHGYDDMGTHVVTSFWYGVSKDGAIYNETMLEYVLYPY